MPNVIEPSFGIGRILTGVLEHCFSVRAGAEQRSVLSFKPAVAPFKAVVLPLDSRIPREGGVVSKLSAALTAGGLASTVDDSSASIGKRYSRSDELGVPFAITVDHDTAVDGCVTLRERDSCAQVRLPLGEVVVVLKAQVSGEATWETVMGKYTVVTTGEDKAAAAATV